MARSPSFAALRAAVAAAHRKIGRQRDPVDQLRDYVELLAVLQEQMLALTAERDAVLRKVLRSKDAPSNRWLADELGISRQRVDQLASVALAGGRRRSRTLRTGK